MLGARSVVSPDTDQIAGSAQGQPGSDTLSVAIPAMHDESAVGLRDPVTAALAVGLRTASDDLAVYDFLVNLIRAAHTAVAIQLRWRKLVQQALGHPLEGDGGRSQQHQGQGEHAQISRPPAA